MRHEVAQRKNGYSPEQRWRPSFIYRDVNKLQIPFQTHTRHIEASRKVTVACVYSIGALFVSHERFRGLFTDPCHPRSAGHATEIHKVSVLRCVVTLSYRSHIETSTFHSPAKPAARAVSIKVVRAPAYARG